MQKILDYRAPLCSLQGIKIHFCEFLYDFALKRNKLPGNITGYGVVPPFLPAMIDIESTTGFHQGGRMSEISAFKVGFHLITQGFMVFLKRKHIISPRTDYLVGYFVLASLGL
jgi:hypothetical protein